MDLFSTVSREESHRIDLDLSGLIFMEWFDPMLVYDKKVRLIAESHPRAVAIHYKEASNRPLVANALGIATKAVKG